MPRLNCEICGTIFYVKPCHQKIGWGKYCSIECRTKSQFNGKKLKCGICSKEVYRSKSKLNKSKSGKFFCSKSCQTFWRNSFFVAEKHSNWTDGIGSYKNLLKNDRDSKCYLCKLRDERILAVHHIDHDRHNNKLSNLIWLCYNCHRLVHIDSSLDSKVRNMNI